MGNQTPAPKIEHLREYFLLFGNVGHYLKRIEEFHASKKTAEPLPPRWIHLAERAFMRVQYPTYLAFAGSNKAEYSPEQLAQLDDLVSHMNAFLQRPGIFTSIRVENSDAHRELSTLYKDLQRTVFSVKGWDSSGETGH